ncbi:hypothetical protein VTO73DRAFT_12264 [Trametes versicolor]
MNKLIIEYAEAEEINGAIVALDQEKAYDRIDHEYLWCALKHTNFPQTFIDTVRSLYLSAESCVIINGARMAIEPLACALRQSTLRGILIPGDVDRLIANLFADDTTVFLGEGDDYSAALAPTEVWCRASRARFNLQKTEVIPVGTKEYRERVVATRKLYPGAIPIPDNVHIVGDGEAIRSLGAWIGNCVDDATPWTPLLNTMRRNLEHWEKGKPTLHGRKLAVDLEVGGRTQFLAKAQGMPLAVESKLTRMIADFMWAGDKHPRVDRATLYAPVEDGGLGVLCITARNEAIDLMRLRDYLDLSPTRPRWALVADALLARAVASTSQSSDPKARLNYFLQNWNPKWNPSQTYHADCLTLTPAWRRVNDTARAEKGRVTFDPSLTQRAPLAAVFRVFTKDVQQAETAVARPPRPFGISEEAVEVYTDGSCIGNGMAEAVAGSGEIYAVILAEQRVAPFAPLHLMCAECGGVDSMRHILTECAVRGQGDVWMLAKALLAPKLGTPLVVSYGLALGSHMFTVLDKEGAAMAGETRCARIVLMEATQLIWALRYQGSTNVRVHKKKATSCAKVKETWKGMLRDGDTLPDDWLNETGVLVGMPPYPDMRDTG